MNTHLPKTSLAKSQKEVDARQQCTNMLWRRLFRTAPQTQQTHRHANHTVTRVKQKSMSLEYPAQQGEYVPCEPVPPPPPVTKTVRSSRATVVASPSASSPNPTSLCDRGDDGHGDREAALSACPSGSASPLARCTRHRFDDEEENEVAAEVSAEAGDVVAKTSIAEPEQLSPPRASSSPMETHEEMFDNVPIADGGETVRRFCEADSLARAEAEYEVPSPSSIQRRTFLSRKRERTPSVLFRDDTDTSDGLVFSPRLRVGRSRGHSVSLSVSRPSLILQQQAQSHLLRARVGGIFIASPDGLVRTPSPAPRVSREVHEGSGEAQEGGEEREGATTASQALDADAEMVCEQRVPSEPREVSAADDRAGVEATLFAGLDVGCDGEDDEAVTDVGEESDVIEAALHATRHAEEEEAVMASSLSPTPLPNLTACEEEPSSPVRVILVAEEVCAPVPVKLFATEEEAPQPQQRIDAVEDVRVELASRPSLDFTSFEWVDEVDAILRAQQQRVASVSPLPIHPEHNASGHTSSKSHGEPPRQRDADDNVFSLPHVSFRSLSCPPKKPALSPQRAGVASPSVASSPQASFKSLSPAQTMPRDGRVELGQSQTSLSHDAHSQARDGLAADGQSAPEEEQLQSHHDEEVGEGRVFSSSQTLSAHRVDATPSVRAHDEVEDESITSAHIGVPGGAASPRSMDVINGRREVSCSPAPTPLPVVVVGGEADAVPTMSTSPLPRARSSPPSAPSAFRFASRVGTRLTAGRVGRNGDKTASSHTQDSVSGRPAKPSLLPHHTSHTQHASAGLGASTSVSQTRSHAAVVPNPPRLATSERARRGKHPSRNTKGSARAKAAGAGERARASVQFELPKTFSTGSTTNNSTSSVRLSERKVNAPREATTSAVGSGKKHKRHFDSTVESASRSASASHQKIKKRKFQ